MKTVIRSPILVVAALACLAASNALAAGPSGGPRSGYTRYAANPKASSRVSNRYTAQATPPAAEPEQISAPPVEEGPIYDGGGGGDPSMWEDTGYGDYYDDGSCSTGCRRGLWYFNIDYLLVKPRFSQGVAGVRSTQHTEVNDNQTTLVSVDESINYCMKYNSSFRLGGGYRLLDCGGDINFTYWRLTGNDSVSDGPATEDNQLRILGQLGNDPEEGQFYSASTGVTANVFDFDFTKCLSLGGPQSPCECNFCPRWDLRWFAGLRGANVTRFNNNVVSDPNGDEVSFGNINASFSGAGPRLGMQGRRYFGQCGMLSIYAKGGQAILIGNYKLNRTLTDNQSGTESPNSITTQVDQFCRTVPVTDIEVGGTWQLAPYAFVSIGWFWQCWWDLGQAENISSGTSFGPLDSANILSFDGLFVRGELLF